MTIEHFILSIIAGYNIFLTCWCFVTLEQRDIALARIKELENELCAEPWSENGSHACAARHECGCYVEEEK